MHKKSKIALVLASLLAFNTHNNLLIMQIYMESMELCKYIWNLYIYGIYGIYMESMIVSFFFWFN